MKDATAVDKTNALNPPRAAVEGWTGGQYSLLRGCLGLTLAAMFFGWLCNPTAWLPANHLKMDLEGPAALIAFPNLLEWTSAVWTAAAVLAVGIVAAGCFTVGWQDRPAAVVAWYVWACGYWARPDLAGPAWPYVGWLLLAHVCLPPAPFGSWAAKGRVDPRGDWRFLQSVWIAGWCVVGVGLWHQAYVRWVDVPNAVLQHVGPLNGLGAWAPTWVLKSVEWYTLAVEVLFLPLGLIGPTRKWAWLAGAAAQAAALMLFQVDPLGVWMLFVWVWLLDPAWIPARGDGQGGQAAERIYYDGQCGLCQRSVRVLLAEDRGDPTFRYAPLQGETFLERTTEAQRTALPDSTVVETVDGRLLVRSTAVLYMAGRLGGMYRVLGAMAGCIPTAARDAGYNVVAGARHRLFAKPMTACPLLPPRLRGRFDF